MWIPRKTKQLRANSMVTFIILSKMVVGRLFALRTFDNGRMIFRRIRCSNRHVLLLLCTVFIILLIAITYAIALDVRQSVARSTVIRKVAKSRLHNLHSERFSSFASSSKNADYWSKRLITVETEIGRLGNKLFQYASLHGIALRYGFLPVLKDTEPLLDHLDGTLLLTNFLTKEEWETVKWRSWWEPRASAYDRQALEAGLRGHDDILLLRFLQSYKYFRGFESEIIPSMNFKPAVRAWSAEYMRNLTRRMSVKHRDFTIVGVHVRRGDYLHDNAKIDGYNTPDKKYYLRALKHFTSRYPFVVFVVCSSEIGWAESVFEKWLSSARNSRSAVFDFMPSNEELPERDLATLSLTNHTIISAGSYSFWAAMLREYRLGKSDGGTTIYYSKPFIPGTRIGESYGNSTDDYYPKHWMKFN